MREDYVFVNGVFDVLHVGHIRLLKQASTLGHLIVGLNSDESVKRIKGDDRPINGQEERREMLMATWAVHDVYIFEEDNPTNLLQAMYMSGTGPRWVLKGEEYRNKAFAERALVRGNGGQIIYYRSGSTRSSTELIARMQ